MELKIIRSASRTERALAFILDIVIFFIWFFIFYFIVYLLKGSSKIISSSVSSVIFAFGLLLFGKDSFCRGRSFGKKILKLDIRKYDNTDEILNGVQLFNRNITILVLPIELIFLILNKESRRLGDLYTKTVVVKVEYSKEKNRKNIKKYNKKRKEIFLKASSSTQKGFSLYIFTIIILIFVIGPFTESLIIKNSKAYSVAVESIKNNNDINELIGEVRENDLIEGEIVINNGPDFAYFYIMVKGDDESINVYITLKREESKQWEICIFD